MSPPIDSDGRWICSCGDADCGGESPVGDAEVDTEARTVAAIVAWLRAEAGKYTDGTALAWAATAIERGDWK